MSKTGRKTATGSPDGRALRSERSRQVIIDAMLELVGEGNLVPTAQQVAERAEVGIRTVFRHFSEMESLYSTADKRLRETYEQSDKPGEVIKLYQEAVRASRNSEKETLSLVLAEMYIDQGQMEEAMQTLWSIANPSIPAHLLLIKAHQDQNQEDKADQVIRAALKKVTSSLSRFVCRQCHKEFEQWSGECPNCDAWDSLDTALHQTL